MKRKIVRLGTSTLITSIPSKWAEKFALKPGDELDVEEQGNKLVMFTDKEYKKQAKEVVFQHENKKYLRRIFGALYKKGYEEIILKGNNSESLDFIESKIGSFIGVEVIEREKDSLKIADIVHLDEGQFDNVFKRCMLIMVQVAEDTVTAFKTHDKELMLKVIRTEDLHNKLTDFCKRLLARKGYKDELRVKYLYALIQENERIVDEFKYVARCFPDARVGKAALEHFERSSKLVREFYSCYYTHDEKKIEHIVLERQHLESTGREFIMKNKGGDSLLVHFSINVAVLMYEIAEPYLEMSY